MGRALSLSLVAHLAFVLSFLLFSATRKPLVIPQIARPVRLVTYLEPAAAPRPKGPAPVITEPRQAPAVPARIETQKLPPARNTPRVTPPPAAAVTAPAAAARVAPVAVPRIAIPVPTKEPPTARAEERPSLSDRLSRQLAAPAPSAKRQIEPTAPQLASLPRPETVAPTPIPTSPPAVPATMTQPQDAVASVGYFPHAWYLAILKDRVFALWRPPSDFLQTNRPYVAQVAFSIDRTGKLLGVAIKQGSGFTKFDQSALAVVRGLGKVDPLPEQYHEETLDVVIRFQNQ